MSLPLSWDRNGKRLIDLKTLVARVPDGLEIYCNEVTDDVSGRNARLSRDVCSAATMEFLINTDAWTDPQLMPILTKTLLGGYWQPTGLKHTPLQHPYLPGLYAKDITGIQDIGFEESNELYGQYSVSKLTISFESLPYPVGKTYSPDDDFNPNFMVRGPIKATNQRTSVPIGVYKFKSDNANYPNLPVLVGNFTTMPLAYLTVTFMEVPAGFLYPLGGLLPAGSDSFGLVNDDEFGDCPKDSLLLDSIEAMPYTDWLGQEMYIVTCNMLYNGWDGGWQAALDPSGVPGVIEYAIRSGGVNKPPFARIGFPTFFDRFNPR